MCDNRYLDLSSDNDSDRGGDKIKEHSLVIYIETLTGTAFEMVVNKLDSVQSIKNKIQHDEGIPVNQQHILYSDRELKNTERLEELGIKNGSTLKLVLGMRGGPLSTRRTPISSTKNDLYLLREIRDFVDSTRENSKNSSSKSNSKMTLLVYKDGDTINLLKVIENDDGSFTPVVSDNKKSSSHHHSKHHTSTTQNTSSDDKNNSSEIKRNSKKTSDNFWRNWNNNLDKNGEKKRKHEKNTIDSYRTKTVVQDLRKRMQELKLKKQNKKLNNGTKEETKQQIENEACALETYDNLDEINETPSQIDDRHSLTRNIYLPSINQKENFSFDSNWLTSDDKKMKKKPRKLWYNSDFYDNDLWTDKTNQDVLNCPSNSKSNHLNDFEVEAINDILNWKDDENKSNKLSTNSMDLFDNHPDVTKLDKFYNKKGSTDSIDEFIDNTLIEFLDNKDLFEKNNDDEQQLLDNLASSCSIDCDQKSNFVDELKLTELDNATTNKNITPIKIGNEIKNYYQLGAAADMNENLDKNDDNEILLSTAYDNVYNGYLDWVKDELDDLDWNNTVNNDKDLVFKYFPTENSHIIPETSKTPANSSSGELKLISSTATESTAATILDTANCLENSSNDTELETTAIEDVSGIVTPVLTRKKLSASHYLRFILNNQTNVKTDNDPDKQLITNEFNDCDNKISGHNNYDFLLATSSNLDRSSIASTSTINDKLDIAQGSGQTAFLSRYSHDLNKKICLDSPKSKDGKRIDNTVQNITRAIRQSTATSSSSSSTSTEKRTLVKTDNKKVNDFVVGLNQRGSIISLSWPRCSYDYGRRKTRQRNVSDEDLLVPFSNSRKQSSNKTKLQDIENYLKDDKITSSEIVVDQLASKLSKTSLLVNNNNTNHHQTISQQNNSNENNDESSNSLVLPPINKKVRIKCKKCNKKLNITTIHTCRCGSNFCSQHRYSEVHGCSYDYKTEGRKIIEKNNPLVLASKLPKI